MQVSRVGLPPASPSRPIYHHRDSRQSALALSHARAGQPGILAGYMGKSDTFDQAIASFAMVYAKQNERDHAALARAVKQGKVKAEIEADR